MNDALTPSGPARFPEHATGMFHLASYVLSAGILPSPVLQWFKSNHKSSTENLKNAPFQSAEGGRGWGSPPP